MWGSCPKNKLTSWKFELYKRTMMLETRYLKTRLNQTWILPCLRPCSGECPHPRALPTIKHKVNRGGYFECGAPGAWVQVRAWAHGNNMNVPVGEWHGDDVIGCDTNMAHWWWWCGVNACMMWHGDDMALMHHLHGLFVQQMPMRPGSNGTTTSCAAAHGNFTFPLHPWTFPHGHMMSAQGNVMSIWGGEWRGWEKWCHCWWL